MVQAIGFRVRKRITKLIREDPARARRVMSKLLQKHHGCLRDVSKALRVHHNTVYAWVAVLTLRRFAADLRLTHGVKGPRDACG